MQTLPSRKCKCGREMLACPSGWVCETCGGRVKPYSEKERKLAITVVAPQPEHGEAECDECSGIGEITCENCEGSGEEECSHCGSVVECEYCDGDGTWTCEKCDGSGTVQP